MTPKWEPVLHDNVCRKLPLFFLKICTPLNFQRPPSFLASQNTRFYKIYSPLMALLGFCALPSVTISRKDLSFTFFSPYFRAAFYCSLEINFGTSATDAKAILLRSIIFRKFCKKGLRLPNPPVLALAPGKGPFLLNLYKR